LNITTNPTTLMRWNITVGGNSEKKATNKAKKKKKSKKKQKKQKKKKKKNKKKKRHTVNHLILKYSRDVTCTKRAD
jgi:hypothetical protein